MLSEGSKSWNIAYSKSPVHESAHPLPIPSGNLSLPSTVIASSRFESKSQRHLDPVSNCGEQIYQPILSSFAPSDAPYDPSIKLSKLPNADDPTPEELALMASQSKNPTREVSKGFFAAKTKTSDYELRVCRRLIKGYNDLIKYINAMLDENFVRFSVMNGFLENMRLDIETKREKLCKYIYFFVLSLRHQREFETLSQLNEEDKATRLDAIRHSIMSHKLKFPFPRYAASQSELDWAVQQRIGRCTRRIRLPKRMKELVRLSALATRRVDRGSNYICLTNENYGHHCSYKKHQSLLVNLLISSNQLKMSCKHLRDLWEEHRILSNLREPLVPARSARSELIYAVLRTQKRLAGFRTTLIMFRSPIARLWKQAPQTNYAGFSTMRGDFNSRLHTENRNDDKGIINGLNLQPTRRQAYEYTPSSQRLPPMPNEINQTIESTKKASSHLLSDHRLNDSHSLSIRISGPVETLCAIHPKTSLETIENNPVVAKSDGSSINRKSCNDQVDQDTAEDRHNSLGFQIPKAKIEEIMLASRESGATYWQYTLYQGPGGEQVKIHYCKNLESTERIAKLFLGQEIVGFDIEWKPQASANEGIKKNVAMIQLASEERIALFHIARYAKNGLEDLVAPTLKAVMESSSITKVGVSIKADCTRLRRFLGINSRGLFELSHLYKLVKFAAGDVKKINKLLVSLACQVEEHLLLPMWKGEVRNSDWSEELNYEQVRCKLPIISYIQY